MEKDGRNKENRGIQSDQKEEETVTTDIFSDSKGYMFCDIYMHRVRCFSFTLRTFSVCDHMYVYITRAHRTCVLHWRQETSLSDDFCNDKTTDIFVEASEPYTCTFATQKRIFACSF